jgi:hemolysin activation/secretion protein
MRGIGPKLILAVLLLDPCRAWAQEPNLGRILKDSFQPKTERKNTTVDVGNFAGAGVPEGAEKVTLRITDVRFVGDASPDAMATEHLRALLTAAEGEGLTIAQIFAAVHATERAISEKGYVLTRLIIPPQEIRPGGSLTIRIVSGAIEKIDAQTIPPDVREPVLRRLAGLLDRPGVTRKEIERALLLAGELGGLALESALSPGASEGGVKLIVSGTFRPYSVKLGVNNDMTTDLGGWNIDSSISVNSPFGQGEQFYLAHQASPAGFFSPDARMRVVAGGAVVPLGSDGLTLAPELVWARMAPDTAPGVPQGENRMARATLKAVQPLIRTPSTTLDAFLSLEAFSQQVWAPEFRSALSSDSFTALRGGIEYHTMSATGTGYSASLKLSKGLGEIPSIFPNGRAVNVRPSRTGAEGSFWKLNGSLGRTSTLGPLSLKLTASGQTSFGAPLYGSEQLSLDGSEALSVLPKGTAAVDEGGSLRAEAGFGFSSRRWLDVYYNPYVFGGLGAGRIHNATVLEASSLRAANLGAGIRLSFDTKSDSLRPMTAGVEVGHSWVQALTFREHTRVNLTFGWSF